MSGDYSDSEDDGPIPYKSDDESEDDDCHDTPDFTSYFPYKM